MKIFRPEQYQKKATEVFHVLKAKIGSVLPNAKIEHIGSSAIRGALSKGDLDVFVGVPTEEFSQAVESLQNLGFGIKQDTLRTPALCMFECFDFGIDVGIQLVDRSSPHADFLIFRDALLNNTVLVNEYNQLKLSAANLSEALYRERKSEFIKSVLSAGTIYKLNQRELSYWQEYLKSLEHPPAIPKVSAAIAGNEIIADELLELYLSGKKTAGSSLVKDYEASGEDLPQVGNFWIILDSRRNPRCIVKTTRVENFQFDQVPVEVALAEGEGDLSLDYWRTAHVRFFSPLLVHLGITDLDKAILITEFFEVVFR